MEVLRAAMKGIRDGRGLDKKNRSLGEVKRC